MFPAGWKHASSRRAWHPWMAACLVGSLALGTCMRAGMPRQSLATCRDRPRGQGIRWDHPASPRRVVAISGSDDGSSVLRGTAWLGQCSSPTHTGTFPTGSIFVPVRPPVAGRKTRAPRKPKETLTISHWRRASGFIGRLDREVALVSPPTHSIGRRQPMFLHPASVGRGLP